MSINLTFGFKYSVDIYGFFYHAMPEEGVLSLEDLHTIIREVWLTRYDEELESERAARRKGRPKSAKEMKLEELKLREAETYRTGMGASFFLTFHCDILLILSRRGRRSHT